MELKNVEETCCDTEMPTQQQLIKDEPQNCTERPEVPLTTPVILAQNEIEQVPAILHPQPDCTAMNLQRPKGELAVEANMNAVQDDSSSHVETNIETHSSMPQMSMTNETEDALAETSTSSPHTDTPQLLMDNSHKLLGSPDTAIHVSKTAEPREIAAEVHQKQKEEPAFLTGNMLHEDERMHTDMVPNHSHKSVLAENMLSDSVSVSNADIKMPSMQHLQRTDKSDFEQCYDEHDCGDGDDGNSQFNLEYGFDDFKGSIYGQQPLLPTLNSFELNRPTYPSYQDVSSFQSHGTQYPAPLDLRHQSYQGTAGFVHGHQPMSLPLEGAHQNPQLYAAHSQHHMGYSDSRYLLQPHTQYSQASTYGPSSTSPYGVQAQSSHSLPSIQRVPTFATTPSQLNARRQASQKALMVRETDSSGDDQPLNKRMTRRPSTTSEDLLGGGLSPPQMNTVGIKQPNQNPHSTKNVAEPKLKPDLSLSKNTNKVPHKQRSNSPSAKMLHKSEKDSPSDIGRIDWTLPKYEARFEPGETSNDPRIAKVSIPGIVREELLLSVEHAEQESHLLLHVFLPTQQRLPEPDTHPALAILNFHTVAIMVIEAFVQFEIGDEIGTGRGHWHNNYSQADAEYKRLRNAKDADPDEIFFAVIDRWRTGIVSNKGPSKLIRGAQEFCDIALDIIHYIRDNGLLNEEQPAEPNKGPKGSAKHTEENSDVEETKSKVVKRGGGKINEPKVTKKAKTDTKAKATPKAKQTKKSRSRFSTVGVTVIRKK